MTLPRPIDLHNEEHEWVSVAIPGSDRPVRLARLFVDPETKASLSLVEFPEGWIRPEEGSYRVAEEFVVLRGAINVSGAHHRAGEYALLPAYTPRADSSTPTGCLALAAFSGPPVWVPGESPERPDHAPVHTPASEAARAPNPSFQGELHVAHSTPDPTTRPVDLLRLDQGEWMLIEPGMAFPVITGTTLVRRW